MLVEGRGDVEVAHDEVAVGSHEEVGGLKSLWCHPSCAIRCTTQSRRQMTYAHSISISCPSQTRWCRLPVFLLFCYVCSLLDLDLVSCLIMHSNSGWCTKAD